jgi:Fe-S oxidoreductase
VKDPTPLAQHDLKRSPSEIEERGTTETAAQLCTRARICETRLLVAGDDLDIDAESRANLGDERVSVARLAYGAGRDRKHGLWFVPFNHRDQLPDRVQGAFERRAGETTGSKDGLADPGHPFGALDHHQARATVHIRN